MGCFSEEFEANKEKFENLFRYYIEVCLHRYDLECVLEISKVLWQKFQTCRIQYVKQAFTHFYCNIQTSQGSISKILHLYAESQHKSIQAYLDDIFVRVINELVYTEENECKELLL